MSMVNSSSVQLTSRQTLWLILLPMAGTFAVLRLYLHLVQVQHVYPGGYLVHHLFTGTLVLIPAAFILAFGAKWRMTAILARVAVGVGSGLILDELTFLVMTQAADHDYVSGISLWGGAGFTAVAALLLWGLHLRHRR